MSERGWADGARAWIFGVAPASLRVVAAQQALPGEDVGAYVQSFIEGWLAAGRGQAEMTNDARLAAFLREVEATLNNANDDTRT